MRRDPRRFLVVAAFWAVLATTTLAGCVGTAESAPAESWTRNGETVDIEVISTNDGPAHCEWQRARFLQISWPIYSAPDGQPRSAQYVRDPEGVLGHEALRRAFRSGATLPEDAIPTGYERDGTALWLADSDRETTAYLVTEDPPRVEAWPRADPPLGCD
ncbi:hypothetical protein [Plantactinospora soyae]|uniref:DUF4232 domain-containing protein n=1 Tax=Plantactinospora soyae TaxID=1544732 RepID=A0A927MGR2_9ACTN|nr:hypothetical protein [Plantactinospora soyae]MBE1491393.1 hypothetical protein [Plantactinospora soyae]